MAPDAGPRTQSLHAPGRIDVYIGAILEPEAVAFAKPLHAVGELA